MLPNSSQNNSVHYLKIDFQSQTRLVFQNYWKTLVMMNLMRTESYESYDVESLFTSIPVQETMN